MKDEIAVLKNENAVLKKRLVELEEERLRDGPGEDSSVVNCFV